MPMPEFNDGQILYAAPLNEVADEVDRLETAKVNKTTTVNGHPLSGNVTVTKANVGLGNADDTSDANKPVSTAQQTALNGKANTVHGHALTDANITGVLPIAQVPTGTTSTTVSLGNHTHTTAQVTSGTFEAARLPNATETAIGAVERATIAETQAGTDTTRYVSPAGVKAVIDTLGKWVDYAPTAFAGITDITSSLSVVEARYSVIGKTVNVILSLKVTTAISSGGTLNFSLPVAPRALPAGAWTRVLGTSMRYKAALASPDAPASAYNTGSALNVSFLTSTSAAGSSGWDIGNYFFFNLTYEAA